jgi:hypothetical protein
MLVDTEVLIWHLNVLDASEGVPAAESLLS